jgi:hypothetical protein
MIGGLPGNSFLFMEFEEGGGVPEVAALALVTIGLDIEELVERFLELAGEALALDAEAVEKAMGVDDVKVDGGLLGGRIGGAIQQVGFEERDAVETPGGVGELVDELGFGCCGGLVFVEELATMGFIRGWVFRGQDGGAGRQAMAQRVERRTLLAGFGARTGGVLGIGAIDGGAIDGSDWGT